MSVNVLIRLRETLQKKNISQERLTNLIRSLPQELIELRMLLDSSVSMIFSDTAAITPSLLSEDATRLYEKCFWAREPYVDPTLDFCEFEERDTQDRKQENTDDDVAENISEIMEFLLLCGANPGVVL